MKITPARHLTVDYIHGDWWVNFAFGVDVYSCDDHVTIQLQLGIFALGIKIAKGD